MMIRKSSTIWSLQNKEAITHYKPCSKSLRLTLKTRVAAWEFIVTVWYNSIIVKDPKTMKTYSIEPLVAAKKSLKKYS